MLHVAHDEDDMLAAHDSFGPDAIVAPFLTKRVPERLWKNNMTCPVLIVHPGVRGDRGVSSIDWALKGAGSCLQLNNVESLHCIDTCVVFRKARSASQAPGLRMF